MAKRGHINLKTKLAAAIGALYFTYDERKELSEDQILSLVQWDHDPILHTPPYNGTDDHFNLVPKLIKPHREKTAKIDQPRIGKGRRLAEAQEEFRRLMLAKGGQGDTTTEGLATAIMANITTSKFRTGRKLQSRNTFQKRKDK